MNIIRKTNYSSPAFTIIELLVVIAAIGILAAITIVSYRVVDDNSNQQAVRTDAQTIGSQLTKYKSENGSYPQDIDGLSGAATIKATLQYSYSSSDDSYCALPHRKVTT